MGPSERWDVPTSLHDVTNQKTTTCKSEIGVYYRLTNS